MRSARISSERAAQRAGKKTQGAAAVPERHQRPLRARRIAHARARARDGAPGRTHQTAAQAAQHSNASVGSPALPPVCVCVCVALRRQARHPAGAGAFPPGRGLGAGSHLGRHPRWRPALRDAPGGAGSRQRPGRAPPAPVPPGPTGCPQRGHAATLGPTRASTVRRAPAWSGGRSTRSDRRGPSRLAADTAHIRAGPVASTHWAARPPPQRRGHHGRRHKAPGLGSGERKRGGPPADHGGLPRHRDPSSRAGLRRSPAVVRAGPPRAPDATNSA